MTAIVMDAAHGIVPAGDAVKMLYRFLNFSLLGYAKLCRKGAYVFSRKDHHALRAAEGDATAIRSQVRPASVEPAQPAIDTAAIYAARNQNVR
jgi:hypothetical protein